MNETNSSIPVLSVGDAIEKLSKAYAKLIESGLPVATMPSVMLWGAPGVGKSQAVRQIAKRIGEETGKRVNVTDVRLLLFNPIDLRGIPTANADKTLAVWLKPKIFQMDEDEEVINILFLDEISAAPPSVQAAAYQITLDRVVGEHKLPDNCIVIAAGNRVTDKSVAYKMPKALANRLLHLEIEPQFEAWREWAILAGIDERIVGFLSFRQNYLSVFDAGNDDLAYPTPRTWEMVSNVLRFIVSDVEDAYPLIAGLVGGGAAVEFRTWCKVYTTLPSIEDIFDGKAVSVPKNTDALYALVASMTAYAREHQDELWKIANSIRYANRMPADYSAVLMKNYLFLDGKKNMKLMNIPEFAEYLRTKGRFLNGIV